jgi:hypothetical protein
MIRFICFLFYYPFQITADIIDWSAYVKILDILLEKTSKVLRTKCDCYVSDTIVSEDDVTYASMIAKVLVPEFKEEIGLPEVEQYVTKFVNIVNALPIITGPGGVIDKIECVLFCADWWWFGIKANGSA